MSEEHIHKWQTAGPWGVILGVCKCELCGKTAEGKDFNHSREDKPHPEAEGGEKEQIIRAMEKSDGYYRNLCDILGED